MTVSPGLRRLLVVVASLGALVALAGPAWGHASFVSATPGPGTGLPQAPGEVVLRFTEPLIRDVSGIAVLDQSGEPVTDGPTRAVEGDVRAMRRPLGLLSPGVYTVEWTTVSPLDGHTLKGSYRFAIGSSTRGGAVVREDPLTSEGPLGLVGTWVALSGLALWFGGAVLRVRASAAGMPARRLDRLALVAVSAVALGTMAALVSTAVGATVSLAGAVSVVLDSGSGRWSALVVVAALARLALGSRVGWWPDVALAGLAVVAEAASGHAGSNPQPLLAAVTFAVHLGVVGVWVFAIVASLLASGDRTRTLARFTRPAVVAAGLAGVSGVASAWLELTGPADLLRTAYGQTILAKGAVFVAMVLVGLVHWWRRRRADATSGTLRLVRAEAALALVAVGVATLLVGFPNPPREAAEATAANDPVSVLQATLADPAVSVAGRSGPYVVGVTLSPPRPGEVAVVVQVEGVEPGDGLRDVRVEAAGPDGSSDARLTECGAGCFRGTLSLPIRGEWALRVVGTTNAERLDTEVTVTLPASSGRDRWESMLEAMDGLRAARVREELRPAAGADPIVSAYRFRAPDRMRWDVHPAGSEEAGPESTRIAVGDTGYLTDDSEPDGWKTYDWIGGAFSWPDGYYREFFTDPAAIRILGRDTVDGTDTTVLGFVQTSYPAWYRLWIDDQDRIRRLEMLADAHFMDQYVRNFDEPVEITPPAAARTKDEP